MALPIQVLSLFAIVALNSGDHFGYKSNNGPATWPGICQSGKKQSPIDIRSSDIDYANLPRIHLTNIEYSGRVTLKNNGHTVIATGFENWEGGRPYLSGGGLAGKYYLVQYHMHWSQDDATGSEHTLASLHYVGEVHFVFIKEGRSFGDGKPFEADTISVLAVLVGLGNDNSPLSFIHSIEKVITYGSSVTLETFQLMPLLPRNLETFYRYNGSLTTPTCDEAVVWTIMTEPISITPKQVATLRKVLFSDGEIGSNYRPTMPLNGRRILFRPPTEACDNSGASSWSTLFSILTSLLFAFH